MKTHRLYLRLLACAMFLPCLQACVPVLAGGAGAGMAAATDRRTSGAYVEDEGIEWRAISAANQASKDQAHVNATSYNRNLLLTGEAPNEEIRQAIAHAAARIPNVRSVTNEIIVGPNTDLSSRTNDTYVTSKVKGRFLNDATFGAHRVKVVTENGTVFLMGLVTQREANTATGIARTTSGVKKVVRVFEYVTDETAKAIEEEERKQKELDAAKASQPSIAP